MKNKLIGLASIVFIGAQSLVALPSCSLLPAVAPAIVTIADVLADAYKVMDTIQDTTDSFRDAGLVSDSVFEQYVVLKDKADKALDATAKFLRGADSLTQEEYDVAIAQFKEAYSDLKELLVLSGVKLPDDGEMKAGVVPGSHAVVIDEPIALTYKVE